MTNNANSNKFLLINDVQVKNDVNGNQYKVVTFEECENKMVFGVERTMRTGLAGKRNMRPATTLPDGNVIKADPFYDTVQRGEIVIGYVARFNTTPYDINGRSVSQYTCVVFNGENGTTIANRNLKAKGACVVDDYGQPTAKVETTYQQAQALEISIETIPQIDGIPF